MNKNVLIGVIIAIILFIYINNQISDFKINRLELNTDKLQSQLRISQITDFHSNVRVDIEGIKNSISKFDPHFIALTGDMIDFKTQDFSVAFKLVEELASLQKPIFFVRGNHEHGNLKLREFMKGLEERGIIILEETSQYTDIEGMKVMIYGSDFYSKTEDYQNIFQKINPSYYNILLSHSPNKPIPHLPEGIDLILSGHTHGGQVRLPVVGGVLSPGEGFFPKYDKGIMKIGDTILYIDSGLGNSVLPIRLFNPVQISEIVIN